MPCQLLNLLRSRTTQHQVEAKGVATDKVPPETSQRESIVSFPKGS